MRITGDHAALAIEGRLDVRTAADARVRLHQAVDVGRGDLVLDLARLESWDATGLGVIMGTHRRAGRIGRRLVLRSVPAQLQRLLVATRLHRILAVEGVVSEPAVRRCPRWARCCRPSRRAPVPLSPGPARPASAFRAPSGRDRPARDGPDVQESAVRKTAAGDRTGSSPPPAGRGPPAGGRGVPPTRSGRTESSADQGRSRSWDSHPVSSGRKPYAPGAVSWSPAPCW